MAFNGLFHRVAKWKDEIVTLHLVSCYCRPYLLYATECLGLTITQMRSLRNTWQCAVSPVFSASGCNVNFVCAMTHDTTLDLMIVNRSIKFLEKSHTVLRHYETLYNVYLHLGKTDHNRLRLMRDRMSVCVCVDLC